MSHALAVLGLAAACALAYLVQRWAGAEGEGEPPCPEEESDCARRALPFPAPQPR